jgi:hypothetical protein
LVQPLSSARGRVTLEPELPAEIVKKFEEFRERQMSGSGIFPDLEPVA